MAGGLRGRLSLGGHVSHHVLHEARRVRHGDDGHDMSEGEDAHQEVDESRRRGHPEARFQVD